MSLSCLNTICCDTDSVNCFVTVCGDQGKFDSSIAAAAIIENDTFPEIGTTVTLSVGGAVVLTECNYAESLLQWIRDKQYKCEGNGKYYHFFHNGLLANGTRAEPTDKLSENGSNYSAKKYLGYDTTIKLMLEEHFLPNTAVLNGIRERAASLSVILFTKQGALVLDNDNDFNVYISAAGFEITGVQNQWIMGSITLAESGLRAPIPYYVASPKSFINKLKTATKFTFGTSIQTGLVGVPCGSSGGCTAYSIAPATAWTFLPTVNELTSCGKFSLIQACNEDVPVAAPVTINEVTGAVASAGLVAGTYKFHVKVTNDCCIQGETCFTINVA